MCKRGTRVGDAGAAEMGPGLGPQETCDRVRWSIREVSCVGTRRTLYHPRALKIGRGRLLRSALHWPIPGLTEGAVAPALARALAVILLTGCSTAKCCGSLVRALVRWVDLVGWLVGWLGWLVCA